jgi:ribosomal protein L37E
MTKLSAQVSAILNNILNGLMSLDEAVAAILRLIESESGASLAAQRNRVDKACSKCGKMMLNVLERKTDCDTCKNTAKKRRQRERLKNKVE